MHPWKLLPIWPISSLNRLAWSTAELRGLAAESLALLRAALFDARFPALFELEVYGAIIGIFELNNLSARNGLGLTPACAQLDCY